MGTAGVKTELQHQVKQNSIFDLSPDTFYKKCKVNLTNFIKFVRLTLQI